MIFVSPRHFCILWPLSPLIKKVIIYDYVCIKMSKSRLESLLLFYLFPLTLKEIKINAFSWVHKNILGLRHYA